MLSIFIGGLCSSIPKKKISDNERLFRNKCGSCHSLPDPGKRIKAEWERIIENHTDRIHLSEKEKLLIINYVFKYKIE